MVWQVETSSQNDYANQRLRQLKNEQWHKFRLYYEKDQQVGYVLAVRSYQIWTLDLWDIDFFNFLSHQQFWSIAQTMK